MSWEHMQTLIRHWRMRWEWKQNTWKFYAASHNGPLTPMVLVCEPCFPSDGCRLHEVARLGPTTKSPPPTYLCAMEWSFLQRAKRFVLPIRWHSLCSWPEYSKSWEFALRHDSDYNRCKFAVIIKTISQCHSRELLVEGSSKHAIVGGRNVCCLSQICVKHILISEYVGISRITDCGVEV
jgi:hypothetical protein